MSRSAFEQAVLSGANAHRGAQFSDGTFPHNYWISPGGNDGTGNGSWEAPFATVRRFVRQAIDGRGDRGLVMPGSYAENVDIGSGSTAGGNTDGGYAKRNIQLIGDDTGYNGLVQIIGDGSTAAPTIRVRPNYTRGFVLKNMELDANSTADTGGDAQPCLRIASSSTLADATATADNYRFLVENVAIRSDDPDVGILFEGATLGIGRKLWIQGPRIGIGFTGSAQFNPSDLDFEDLDFRDCVTADIATVGGTESQNARTTIAARALTNVAFLRPRHWDRGGTPVTNYVNFSATSMTNVHFFDGYAARDVADNTLIVLPVDVVWIGNSAAGAEFVIGA